MLCFYRTAALLSVDPAVVVPEIHLQQPLFALNKKPDWFGHVETPLRYAVRRFVGCCHDKREMPSDPEAGSTLESYSAVKGPFHIKQNGLKMRAIFLRSCRYLASLM
jgi:hypothetical protein